MNGNGDLSEEKLSMVRGLIEKGTLKPRQIAAECRVSRNTVYYQLQVMGRYIRSTREPVVTATVLYNHRLCFCSGCYKPATDGKFCEDHSAPAMAQRVTAGMSEATRRKLMGAR